MSNIYSRGGDRGQTGLLGGARVSKHDPRIVALGEVDELNTRLGVARVAVDADLSALLGSVQRDLFALASRLASGPASRPTADAKGDWGPARVERLEREIDGRDAALPVLRRFILPGGSAAGATLHLARTVCRRAERAVVGVAGAEPVDESIVAYLNRLSDLLFVLARQANAVAGVADEEW